MCVEVWGAGVCVGVLVGHALGGCVERGQDREGSLLVVTGMCVRGVCWMGRECFVVCVEQCNFSHEQG